MVMMMRRVMVMMMRRVMVMIMMMRRRVMVMMMMMRRIVMMMRRRMCPFRRCEGRSDCCDRNRNCWFYIPRIVRGYCL
ncbi:hypothetical protein ElyMa_001935500 [Elysia marginata]|uniref:Secreted protein n=1 Tax=Elysia marginata TaxID=1093978 RepID=A0AAV4EUV2_9GAST|nr:hypothetical protein ElyMa_001935500 [Elysia marginata]